MATFQLWELDATKTASIHSREIALSRHHADEEHHVVDEKGKAADPEVLAAPALPEEAPSESLSLHKRTHACRNNQQRSCGKVGMGRQVALHLSASCVTRRDIWHETVPNEVPAEHRPKELSARHFLLLVAVKDI